MIESLQNLATYLKVLLVKWIYIWMDYSCNASECKRKIWCSYSSEVPLKEIGKVDKKRLKTTDIFFGDGLEGQAPFERTPRSPNFKTFRLCILVDSRRHTKVYAVKIRDLRHCRQRTDRLCGLVVRVPGYRTEMYCVSCEVRTEFIYGM
jgi:hypothetical protein